MKAIVYWIENPTSGRIGTMPKPRGNEWLETEMQSLQQTGVDVVVSLLTYAENRELSLTEEAAYCQAQDLDFITYPIPDFDVPASKIDASKVVRTLAGLLDEGKSIAIHCRAGIGRSSLIAASILTTFNLSSEEAFARIEQARGRPVPDTQAQKDWVEGFVKLYSQLT